MVCCHNSHFNWLLLFYSSYTNPNDLNTSSHIVSVNALNNVVIIITPELSVPSCPIFLAITKQLTVVADPSITRIAIISSFLNPRSAAIGKKTTQNPTSFINTATSVGFIFDVAFFISKVAPIDISPIGVAVAPILDTVLCKIDGIGSLSADQTNPATIPIMIGFVAIPFSVFFTSALSKEIIPRFKTLKAPQPP